MRWLTTLILLAAAICSCSSKSDTDVIRDLISRGARLAEEKQIGDLINLTAKGFTASPGSYDALSVKGVLFRAFFRYGEFKIYYPKPAVELFSEKGAATALVYFLIVRQGQEIPGLKDLYDDPVQWMENAGKKADLYRLDLELIKAGSLWLVHRAHLEGFKGTGF